MSPCCRWSVAVRGVLEDVAKTYRDSSVLLSGNLDVDLMTQHVGCAVRLQGSAAEHQVRYREAVKLSRPSEPGRGLEDADDVEEERAWRPRLTHIRRALGWHPG